MDWELRGSFTTLEEMMEALDISVEDFADGVTEERLLDYIQFLANVVVYVDASVRGSGYAIYRANEAIGDALAENCQYILEYLGAEMVREGQEIVVVYRDDAATAVKEQNPDLSGSIVEYQKIDNRGDLQRKGEILCTLAKKLEPLEPQFKRIGARHAWKPEHSVSSQFMSMDEAELEGWYDNAFKMFLACMSVLPYLDVKSQLKSLKSGNGTLK